MVDKLISQQAAIDAIKEYFARIGKLKRRGLTKGEKAISLDMVGTIKTLPPAQIEPEAISKWKKEFREYVDSLDIARDDWKGIIEYIDEVPSVQPEHCGDAVSRNAIVQKLNEMDRYVSAELRLCDTDKKFPQNEVFIVDDVYEEIVEQLPSVQPETAKRIVGKSRGGMTLWYQCDMCNEPVDEQDNFCRGCGRRLIDETD